MQALAEDLVKRFAQLNSKTMTLSEGDWEKIQEMRIDWVRVAE